MKGTYFGNGVYVTDRGVLHLEFKQPAASLGIQAARSFKESLEEAIVFAERQSTQSSAALDLVARRHAAN